MKGCFIISSKRKEPTAHMESAMYQAHGVTYAQYENCFATQLEVERQREKDHKKSMRFVAEITNKVN